MITTKNSVGTPALTGLFAILIIAVLAGCAEPMPAAAPAPSPDGILPADAGALQRDVERLRLMPPPAAAPAGPPKTAELVGMTGRAINELLGKPRLLRREGPGQVWQYANTYCVLDLFLYREGGDFQVAHVETRSRDSGKPAKDGCVAALINAASGRSRPAG